MLSPSSSDVPDVSVLRHESDGARSIYLELDERHEVLPYVWPWVESLRRTCNLPNLFVYRHRITGRFVLCNWVFKPHETTRPVAMELEGFTDVGYGWWPDDLMACDVLKARLQPMGDLQEKYARRERDRMSAEQERLDSLRETKTRVTRSLRKRGLDWEAQQVECGAVPVADPSPEIRDLVNAA